MVLTHKIYKSFSLVTFDLSFPLVPIYDQRRQPKKKKKKRKKKRKEKRERKDEEEVRNCKEVI